MRSRLAALLLLLAVACAGGCADKSKLLEPSPNPLRAPELTANQQRMIDVLRDVDEHPDDLPFQGTRKARDLNAQIEHLPADAAPKERAELLLASGQAELNLGHTREGIERLENALALSPEPESEEHVQAAFYLGVGYMRLGEDQNCCARNAPESCILPIQGKGVHTLQEGSRNAIANFRAVIDATPPTAKLHLTSVWLLNLAYMTLGEYPDQVPAELRITPAAFRSTIPFPHFVNVAASVGMDMLNLSGGVVIDDLNGDGYLDVLTSTIDVHGPMHFFRNDGNGKFTDRTAEAGLSGLLGGLNMVQADYDNDGDLDVLVLRGAWFGSHGQIPCSLLQNQGDGSFVDVTFESGLGEVNLPTQVAGWADYDNDGDVDLFKANESSGDFVAPCQLFRNEGNGKFTDVAQQAGTAFVGFVKGASWGDYDADGDPDLYISELVTNNVLYRNNGDGTFTDVAQELGVEGPKASFPTWFWDFDNDGNLDLFVSGYTGRMPTIAAYYLGLGPQFEPAALYRGNGRGGFDNVAARVGLTAPMLPMGSNFGDLNNDGWLDFYLGTGDPGYESLMPNLMYLSQAGRGFVDVTMAGGFGHLQKGHSIAFADLDADGDLDVFAEMGGAVPGDKSHNLLFENPGFGNRSLTVIPVGVESNHSAIGVQVAAFFRDAGVDRAVHRTICSGGSFGADPLRELIGIGKADRVDRLEIFWPTTGKKQEFRGVRPGLVRVVEGASTYERLALHAAPLGGPPG